MATAKLDYQVLRAKLDAVIIDGYTIVLSQTEGGHKLTAYKGTDVQEITIKDGESYILTDEDKAAIADLIDTGRVKAIADAAQKSADAAAAAKTAAQAAKTAAEAAAASAGTAGTAAINAAVAAANAATSAQSHSVSAMNAASQADASQQAALQSKNLAEGAAQQTAFDKRAAEAAKQQAESAAGKITNLDVSSVTLPAGSEAYVKKSETNVVHLELGIPAGPKGDPYKLTPEDRQQIVDEVASVAVQPDTPAPEQNAVLWLDTDADESITVQTEDGGRELKTKLVKARINGEWTDVPALTGKQGKPGLPGNPGYSPTIEATETEDGVKLTITDIEGQRTATVPRGPKGETGSDAQVTKANIERALSYTPADAATAATKQSVSELEQQHDRDVERLEADIEQATPKDYEAVKRRLTNLEYAANGVLYREDVSESEDYTKDIAPDIMPYGTLDKIGGKTIVMNQLVGDTYPKAFEGEVYEQTIEDKAKTVDVDSISGKTIKWNQLYRLVEGRRVTEQGVTFTESATAGTIIANGTSTGVAYTSTTAINVTQGHKYLLMGCPQGGSNTTYRAYITGRLSMNDYGNGTIREATESGASYGVGAYVSNGYTVNNLVFKPRLFDLTLMYGAGNEPSTVEEFRAMFPADYYPYSEPTLKNLDVREVVSKGRNLVDLSDLSFSDATYTHQYSAAAYPQVEAFRRFMMIHVGETFRYTVSATGTVSGATIGQIRLYSGGVNLQIIQPNTEFVVPDTAESVQSVIIYGSTNGATVSDIQISKSDLPFAPYRAPITRDPSAVIAKYFPSGMKSAGAVHDTIDFKRGVAVQRVERMDIPASAPAQITADSTRVDCGWHFKMRALSQNVVLAGFDAANAVVTNAVGEFAPRDNNKYITFGVPTEFSGDMTGAGEWIRSRAEYLYAELETYIETPIAPEDLAILKAIPVEQGGTLTFEHVEGFAVPIPVTETINLSEWEQPLDATHRYSKNGTLLAGTSATDVKGGQDYIIDLTRAGVDTPAAFPEPYYAPNAGELISKAHEAVVSKGVNLWDEVWELGNIATATGLDVASTTTIRSINYIPVSPNTRYYVIKPLTNTLYIFEYRADKSFIQRTSPNNYTSSAETAYIRINLNTTEYDDCVIVSTAPSGYVPYMQPITYDVADIIRKYFPDGMRSAGAVADELDIEHGVAVKRVGDLDMSTLPWLKSSTVVGGFTVRGVDMTNVALPIVNVSQIRFAESGEQNMAEVASHGTMSIGYGRGAYAIYAYDERFVNVNDFVADVSGSRILLELAAPITTTIAPEDLAALRTLHVEAGGSLTFTDTNAGFRIPCGNKETFLVKTGGITA